MSGVVRRSARQVTHGIGRLTSGSRVLPTFLVAGAQRCGTSSLYRALAQHPNVLTPVLQKGVHYFDLNYGRDLAWYRSHFPRSSAAERIRSRTGSPAQAFESSPFYLFHPLAAERIARDLPEAKVLVLVRDPVERAFSAHAHESARGFDTEPFEAALELEPRRTAGERERMTADPTYVSRPLQHQAYVERGQYVDQLRHLTLSIPRERVLVVDSHRLFEDPAPAMAEVLTFLGLPDDVPISYEQHNARPRTPMPPGVRERLEAHFAPYDEQLAAWLGWTPRWMG